MRIALDAMGGDLAPAEQVKGALLAAKEYGLDIALVGPPELLQAELAKQPPSSHITVIPAADTIAMEEDKIVQAVMGQHEPARMLAEMAWSAAELAGDIDRQA